MEIASTERKFMSITDMIKKSVLEGFTSGDLTTTGILVSLGMAALIGLFIYFVYRFSTKHGFYNRSFNKSLAIMPMITTGILLAMQSNLVISLGMVGALSIVRFRNAVKDPLDLLYLFWSISIGIIFGAGLFELAVLLSLGVTLFVFLLDLLPALRAPCILVVSTNSPSEDDIVSAVKLSAPHAKIRSRNVSARGTDWIFELQTKESSSLVDKLSSMEHVLSVNLMTHDGDVRF